MHAQFFGKVEITVGGYRFVNQIYVVPLYNKMLLGIDFRRPHGAHIPFEIGALIVRWGTCTMHD